MVRKEKNYEALEDELKKTRIQFSHLQMIINEIHSGVRNKDEVNPGENSFSSFVTRNQVKTIQGGKRLKKTRELSYSELVQMQVKRVEVPSTNDYEEQE